jgi:PAS domain-containing protein
MANSLYFALEVTIVSRYSGFQIVPSGSYIATICILMTVSTYSMRRMLTKFFLMNTDAEKTRDALTLILDNLPDAVLMLDAGKLCYCNQQADSFFKVSLSHLTCTENDRTTMQKSQYQLMNNRCLHELKTVDVDRVAAKMESTDYFSRSICMTELG